ncbi:MAG TPA: hydroxyacid dehydrogenase [Thermomicrobiales bacterium]|nr:hydroxyacid dehydrogenase [Thermomicrobiales bacterium]
MKPRILSIITPALYDRLFAPDVREMLHAIGEVTLQDDDTPWTSGRLASVIGDYDALITCWGAPKITPDVLDAATRLRIVAHAAGSVKFFIGEDVLERGIRVSSASAAMAPAVAEFALTLTMLGLRPVHAYDRAMRRAPVVWDTGVEPTFGQEIASSRIGVVGAGLVGRQYIAKVKALGAKVVVADPYLSDADAARMGVERLDLSELMASCPIVVIHAPTTPETHHMIGKAELAAMQDDGYLVNTARSWIVDQDALLAELQSGRLRAALDVYDEEPLPADHPYRALENVILTPHVAGASRQTNRRQGLMAVEDIHRLFAGEPLLHEVTKERYKVLA